MYGRKPSKKILSVLFKKKPQNILYETKSLQTDNDITDNIIIKLRIKYICKNIKQ